MISAIEILIEIKFQLKFHFNLFSLILLKIYWMKTNKKA